MVKERKFGVGFVVGEGIHLRVLAFTPVDERLDTIRIKTTFFNISQICVHVPTEEKHDVTKDVFDVKIVLGDFNARVVKRQGTSKS